MMSNNDTTNSNILETVQFISIFSYFNALSDFLFIENYLIESDQNRQIPVVNALYEYLEDYQYNKTMMLKLIRRLLKGSDLYGEEENESVDGMFVNTMFDYIIKSLVFDKYGNIYGFLADVVRKAKTLQLNFLLNEININLQSATFENEYGESSILTPLAAKRIFTDIILPFFPQPKTDLDLLSLDYIYAQAGSNFLRPGRINNTYYTDTENCITTDFDEETLFDEYLTTGLILNNYLLNENINLSTLRAFALPALFLYVSTESFEREETTNIVFDQHYWKAAYDNLFLHLHMTFNKIEETLKYDTNYQIHRAFSIFNTYSALAKLGIDHFCKVIKEEEKISKILDYLHHPEKCQYGKEYLLPLTVRFMDYVNAVGEAFVNHDLKSVKQSFGNSSLKSLQSNKVSIQLLAPKDIIVYDMKRIPYDLFVFYYPGNITMDYYALMRENYMTTLIKDVDNTEDFRKQTDLTVEMLLNNEFRRINLKLVNESMDVFWENYMSYKKQRLESYLKLIGQNLSMGDWWKEFGLSLVPFYHCLATSTHNQENTNDKISCQIDDYIFLSLLDENMSLLFTEKNTRALLTSLGMTLKTNFLKNLIDKEIYSINESNKIVISSPNQKAMFEKLSLHIDDPGFQLTSTSKDYLEIFVAITYALQNKGSHGFKHIKNIINNIKILNFSASRPLLCIDKDSIGSLYIKHQINAENNGYGYKFIYLTTNRTAQLRTDYRLQTKNFISLTHIESDGETVYSLVENGTFKVDGDHTFYNNPQLQRIGETVLFLGISVNSYNNKKCDIEVYKEKPTPLVECPRHARVMRKWSYLFEAIEPFTAENLNITREQMLETMRNYIFPDQGRVELQLLQEWANSSDLQIPKWAEFYKIDNPDLLLKLRNNFHLDDRNLSNFNGTLRIDSIYTFRERRKIESRTTMGRIIQNFIDQEARYVTTFEDYYAIRNFATTGYTRITGSTIEANQMKIALYKLAIRQSDDPEEEFDKTLFRIEAKPIEVINRTLSSGKLHILHKFSTTKNNELLVVDSAAVAMPGYKNILYEMKFSKSYFRAKIRQYDRFYESVSILLPGSKFFIKNITETRLPGLGDCLKVELKYKHVHYEEYLGYKNIMKEITRIMSITE